MCPRSAWPTRSSQCSFVCTGRGRTRLEAAAGRRAAAHTRQANSREFVRSLGLETMKEGFDSWPADGPTRPRRGYGVTDLGLRPERGRAGQRRPLGAPRSGRWWHSAGAQVGQPRQAGRAHRVRSWPALGPAESRRGRPALPPEPPGPALAARARATRGSARSRGPALGLWPAQRTRCEALSRTAARRGTVGGAAAWAGWAAAGRPRLDCGPAGQRQGRPPEGAIRSPVRGGRSQEGRGGLDPDGERDEDACQPDSDSVPRAAQPRAKQHSARWQL